LASLLAMVRTRPMETRTMGEPVSIMEPITVVVVTGIVGTPIARGAATGRQRDGEAAPSPGVAVPALFTELTVVPEGGDGDEIFLAVTLNAETMAGGNLQRRLLNSFRLRRTHRIGDRFHMREPSPRRC
jgi:hypothetical protein